MTRTRAKRLAKLLLYVAALSLLFFAARAMYDRLMSSERRWFRMLWLTRREPDIAITHAKRLASTQRGAELAIEDLSVGGGSTRGWSSWILLYSPLRAYVVRRLSELVEDAGVPLDKRVEALVILWERTRDPSHLESCFLAVRRPGPPIFELYRLRLWDGVRARCKSPDVMVSLTAPPSQPIPMSLAEFRRVLGQSQAQP